MRFRDVFEECKELKYGLEDVISRKVLQTYLHAKRLLMGSLDRISERMFGGSSARDSAIVAHSVTDELGYDL